jgi:hypothetical protein
MGRRKAPWVHFEPRAGKFVREGWHSVVLRGLGRRIESGSLVAVFGAGRFGASKLVAEGELQTK